MTLTHIAMQNLRRRKGRTCFLLFTYLLIVGTIICLSVISSAMKEDLQKSLTQYGANIVITPRSEHFTMSYGGLSVPGMNYEVKKLDEGVLSTIQGTNTKIDVIAPKVIGSVQSPTKRYLVIGVDFPSEFKIKPWWSVDGNLPQPREVVVGSAIATKDKLNVGSTIELAHQNYRVAGIMKETGSSEDNGIFTTITTARTLTGITNAWSMIELNTIEPEKTAAGLNKRLPEAKVVEVAQLVQGTQDSVARFAHFSLTTSVILGIFGLLILIVTMAGNIRERVTELGVLRAIGFRQHHILWVLTWETLLVSFVGGVLGYVLGILAPLLMEPLLSQKTFAVTLHPWMGLLVIIGAVFAGLISMSYPAWRAAKLDPAEALRLI
ncbi:ABC transporter permease [Paradesulfitobacterium aromaticivorans]